MTEDIDWYVCTADQSDVEWAHAIPRPGDPDFKRNAPKVPRKPNLKVGDELWRVPLSIGPIGIDHDHWAGYHLTCTPDQAKRVAYLIANDPDFPSDAP